MSKPNRAQRILAFLEARYPGWVPAVELEPIGGRQAWRTAVSEARALVKAHGDDIENRVRQQWSRPSGQPWTLSEYRLKKRGETATSDPTQIQAADIGPAIEATSHDLNGFSLR